MIFTIIRDGAKLEVTNSGFANFRGVAAAAFLDPKRVTSLMPPTGEIVFQPGILYKVHTGLVTSRSLLAKLGIPDVRPLVEIYKKTGMQVCRVDIDGNMKDGELVVWISVLADFALNKNESLFESFAIGQAQPQISVAEELQSASGFVPVATKVVHEPSKRPAASPQGHTEMSDAQRQAALDKWLNDEGPATKEVITPSTQVSPVNHTLPSVDGTQLRPAEVRRAAPTGE